MFEINGKYNTSKVFIDNLEQTAIGQIIELCNQKFVEGEKIRIMPDAHAGSGCVIGLTMTVSNTVIPNLVGVDIGCGMYVVELGNINIDLNELDDVINKYIPSGFNVHEKPVMVFNDKILCRDYLEEKDGKFSKSIGTLGGGNHFIELNEGDNGEKFLVIHSGSRNLGKQVADFYQKIAIKNLNESGIPKDLRYLESFQAGFYLVDMYICQRYAQLNREIISKTIIEKMKFDIKDQWHTAHNFIDMNTKILRKGAVEANDGQRLIIPMNMRDGSLICIGKGNPDWNYSAPHGAGRIMSRGDAKRQLNISDFEKSMTGIHSTSVKQSTIDESPMAYKSMQSIIDSIGDTVDIKQIIRPIYNFKAS